MPRFAVWTLAATWAACGADPGEDVTDPSDLTDFTDAAEIPDDATIAADLWEEIADYATWDQLGWSPTPALSGDHRGSYVTSFYNDEAVAWGFDGPAPAGTIAVKAQYAVPDEANPANLVVMKKIPGYDPENGDWFYAMYDIAGEPGVTGKVPLCLGCHARVADSRDYVFGEPPAAVP
jgi:hypothetical protein